MKKITVLLLLCITITACEKDDICSADTLTTPRLFMEFYDISNQESLKNVFKFRVQGVDNETVLSEYDIVTANSVLLPLKTTDNITQYRFHQDYDVDDNGTPEDTSDDIILGNEDIITIAYNTEEIYVSRACGFKTIFTNITIVIEDDGDTWIDLIQPLNDNQIVADEIIPHFNLFH